MKRCDCRCHEDKNKWIGVMLNIGNCCECNCHEKEPRSKPSEFNNGCGCKILPCGCKCTCQREFKKGDWVKRDHGLVYITMVEFGDLHGWCINGIQIVIRQSTAKELKPHTLTADDLIPCPYCGGEMELNNNIDGSWCYCPNNRCRLSLGLRKTEHEAVADVLLLRMREDACGF